MSTPESARSLSAHAEWRVWQALTERNDWVSIADLKDASGLSRPTVKTAIESLQRRGWIESTLLPSASRAGGRPAEVYRFAPESAHLLVARISGHAVDAVVLNAAGEENARNRIELRDPSAVVDALVEASRAAVASAGHPLIHIGVVATIGICHEGQVLTSHLFPTLEGLHVRERCQAELGFPISFENDAKMSGIAQLRGVEHSVVDLIAVALHLDEALGCALAFSGRLIDGAHGAAGELGFSSGLGWGEAEKHLKEVAARHRVSPRDVLAQAPDAQPWATELLNELGDLLTQGVLGLLLALDPHVLLVGGPGGVPGSPMVQRLVANLETQVPSMPSVIQLADPECVLNGSRERAMQVLSKARRATVFRDI